MKDFATTLKPHENLYLCAVSYLKTENPAEFQPIFITLAKYYLACWATFKERAGWGEEGRNDNFQSLKLFKSPP